MRKHVKSRPFSYSNSSTLHWRWGDLLHLLEHGSIVKLLLRAYGCLNYCSPTFPRLFNLTVLLQAQDKMVNPCSGSLSEQSTHSLEYGISLQIPSAHFRCDPINARICVFHFHPSPHRHMIRILFLKEMPVVDVFLKYLEINVFIHSFVACFF